MCDKYNGWTNYETWLVKLWLDNSEGDSIYMSEQAQEFWNNAEPAYTWETKEDRATSDMEEFIREYIDENNPIDGASLYSDLLSAAISSVDWREIARSYIDEVDKDEPEQEEE